MYFEAISLTILASIIYQLEDNQQFSGDNGQKLKTPDYDFEENIRNISYTQARDLFCRKVATAQTTAACEQTLAG